MLVVVFRNRLREGVEQEYGQHAERVYELARSMPGFVASKDFRAEDGERLTIVEFRSAEELQAWRTQAEHAAAQQRGRDHYYTEYSLQVCEQLRESRFSREG
ncbi:MAG: antibiotic biosynthesis monooxygenase [Myxococcales bacterium]|nr:MAG: antibiotic biosynthesis monooxygenase [Myxococcales bacterium]